MTSQNPAERPAELLAQTQSAPVQAPAAELGYANVSVPSRGVLYADRLPGGIVQMRKMLSYEQGRLQQQGGGILEKIEAVVNACTRVPKTFNTKDFLLVDAFYLMLALRTMSFGSKYTFTYRCPYCKSIEKSTVDIVADLDETVADEDLREPFVVQLVDAKRDVHCRFLRVSDQDLITKYAKRVRMSSNDPNDPSYQYRLALQLDDPDLGNILDKQKFVATLTAADALRLEKHIDDLEPGVDLTVYPECKNCGATNDMNLPFDAEFFVQPTFDAQTLRDYQFFLVYHGHGYTHFDVEHMPLDELEGHVQQLYDRLQEEHRAQEQQVRKARARRR